MEVVEFYQEGKWRRESDAEGQAGVLIDRRDLRVSWALNAKTKSFAERHISENAERLPWLLNPFGPRANANFKRIGTEDIEGKPAWKYEVSGERVEGLAWFSQEGIPLRFRGKLRIEGAEANVEIDYREIEKGPQPGWLFAVPPNYAGYEERKKPETSSMSVDSESVRRARENLEREHMRGSGPRF